jgi:hypothetical protein
MVSRNQGRLSPRQAAVFFFWETCSKERRTRESLYETHAANLPGILDSPEPWPGQTRTAANAIAKAACQMAVESDAVRGTGSGGDRPFEAEKAGVRPAS